MGATVPQAVKLFRTRDASSFSFPFVALNAAGIGLLLVRSIELRDPGFMVVNSVTFSFWLALAGFKLRDRARLARTVTLRPAEVEAAPAVRPEP